MTYLLQTKGLKKFFQTQAGSLHAVDGIDLEIAPGTTLGVVGESGCGKSTLGRVILRLIEATAGTVLFEGKDVMSMKRRELADFRREAQIIFQDPYASLNPRLTLSESIAEPLIVNKTFRSRQEMQDKIRSAMDTVGLASRLINTYPHELDGGRRQRIGIARALVLEPKFIVCDEPVSALDVSIQAQILNLLMDLQDDMGLTYMFITHDLSVVKHISDEILVMYRGICIERAKANRLFAKPLHPYTQALLKAIPIANLSRRGQPADILKGEVTSPVNLKPGCRFASRCAYATEACTKDDIPLVEVEEDHYVACVLHKRAI